MSINIFCYQNIMLVWLSQIERDAYTKYDENAFVNTRAYENIINVAIRRLKIKIVAENRHIIILMYTTNVCDKQNRFLVKIKIITKSMKTCRYCICTVRSNVNHDTT